MLSSGGRKDQLKDLFNCVNIPLAEGNQAGESNMHLLSPPTALHLKLGLVNKFISIMIDYYCSLENWVAGELNILREEYNGKQFEGKYKILQWLKLRTKYYRLPL